MMLVFLLLLLWLVLSSSRKCVNNRHGLPDGIKEQDIVLSHSKIDTVPYPNKVYYHGIHNDGKSEDNVCLSGYIYIIGGKNTMYPYIAKIDSVSLEVYQKVKLPTSLSIGNAIIITMTIIYNTINMHRVLTNTYE